MVQHAALQTFLSCLCSQIQEKLCRSHQLDQNGSIKHNKSLPSLDLFCLQAHQETRVSLDELDLLVQWDLLDNLDHREDQVDLDHKDQEGSQVSTMHTHNTQQCQC